MYVWKWTQKLQNVLKICCMQLLWQTTHVHGVAGFHFRVGIPMLCNCDGKVQGYNWMKCFTHNTVVQWDLFWGPPRYEK